MLCVFEDHNTLSMVLKLKGLCVTPSKPGRQAQHHIRLFVQPVPLNGLFFCLILVCQCNPNPFSSSLLCFLHTNLVLIFLAKLWLYKCHVRTKFCFSQMRKIEWKVWRLRKGHITKIQRGNWVKEQQEKTLWQTFNLWSVIHSGGFLLNVLSSQSFISCWLSDLILMLPPIADWPVLRSVICLLCFRHLQPFNSFLSWLPATCTGETHNGGEQTHQAQDVYHKNEYVFCLLTYKDIRRHKHVSCYFDQLGIGCWFWSAVVMEMWSACQLKSNKLLFVLSPASYGAPRLNRKICEQVDTVWFRTSWRLSQASPPSS